MVPSNWNMEPAHAKCNTEHQGRIEPPKAARGHATHIDGIVLKVTKFRIHILCSLHCVTGRSARAIEVLRLKCLD